VTRLDLACTGKQHCSLATPNTLYELRKIYLPQNFTLQFHSWLKLNDLHTPSEFAAAPALDGQDNINLVNHTSTNICWFSSRLLYWIKTAHFSIKTIPFLSKNKGRSNITHTSQSQNCHPVLKTASEFTQKTRLTQLQHHNNLQTHLYAAKASVVAKIIHCMSPHTV